MSKRINDQDKKRIWGETAGFKIFLSHLSKFKAETSLLKNKLEVFGICSFVAHEDINPGMEWQRELKVALHTMDGFIALMTDGFHESPWTDQEIGFALCRDITIISVNLGCTPRGFINSRQALSCTWNDAPLKILKLLLKKSSMVDAYIESVKLSGSFADSNELAKALPFIEKLSSQQVGNLISAFNENRQVYQSSGFFGDIKKDDSGIIYYLNYLTKRKYKFEQDKIVLSN